MRRLPENGWGGGRGEGVGGQIPERVLRVGVAFLLIDLMKEKQWQSIQRVDGGIHYGLEALDVFFGTYRSFGSWGGAGGFRSPPLGPSGALR